MWRGRPRPRVFRFELKHPLHPGMLPFCFDFHASPSPNSALHIAIDTGGTFTDCVWVERGQVRMLKVFSTPADPSQAIVEALEKIGHA